MISRKLKEVQILASRKTEKERKLRNIVRKRQNFLNIIIKEN